MAIPNPHTTCRAACSALLIIAGGLLLSGCGGDRAAKSAAVSDRQSARDVLAQAAKQGPVMAKVRGQSFELSESRRDAVVTQAMADGIQGMDVRFTTDPRQATSANPQLVVWLNPERVAGPDICQTNAQARAAPPEEPTRILAAFCDHGEVLAIASSEERITAAGDHQFRRLLWRTSRDLFPDDYWNTYGVDLVPGLNIGIGGSVGF